MDYYKTFTTFMPDKEIHLRYFSNRLLYILENLSQFVQCDEVNLNTTSLVYSFEHNYKAIIVALSNFIPEEKRKNLWLYDWNNNIFRDQLYDLLISLDQPHLILWFFLNCGYFEFGEYEKDVLKLKSNMDYLLEKGLNFKNIDLLYNHLLGKNLLPFFSITYRNKSNKDIFSKRDKFYRSICENLNYKVQKKSITKIGKRKVGFISDFLILDSSVLRDRMGIIKNLNREEFEVFIIVHGKPEHIKTNLANSLKDKHLQEYVFLPPILSDSREKIASLELDILVFCEIGMSVKNFLLAFSRLAPIQLTTWGHSDTSGISTIDYYISSKYFEFVEEDNYTEKLVLLESLGTYYYKPSSLLWDESYKILDRKNYNLDEESNIYGCIQSCFKISEEFEDILSNILENDPKAKIILSNNIPFCKSHILRLKNKMGDNYTRISVFPNLKPDSYLNLIYLCDIILDPYPFGGCNTSFEAFEFNIPVVTMPTKFINGRFTYGLYKKMNILKTVVSSKEEYVNVCLKYGRDKIELEELKNEIDTNKHLIFEEEDSVKDWNDLLLKLE